MEPATVPTTKKCYDPCDSALNSVFWSGQVRNLAVIWSNLTFKLAPTFNRVATDILYYPIDLHNDILIYTLSVYLRYLAV